MPAQPGAEFNHLRRKRANSGKKTITAGQGAEHHSAGGRAGHSHRTFGQGGVGVLHCACGQAQGLRMGHQPCGAFRAARGNKELRDPHAFRKSFQMSSSLHACTHNQHRPLLAGCQPPGGQNRHRCRAPSSHCRAIEQHQALATGHVKHQHVASNGCQAQASIGWREGDYFSDGGAGISGRHDKQAGSIGQGQHQTGRHLNTVIKQQAMQLANQQWIGQAFSREARLGCQVRRCHGPW